MTRLGMENKPSTNISESTELEDFQESEPEACEVLMKDIYVDNVFVTAPDLEQNQGCGESCWSRGFQVQGVDDSWSSI